MFTGIIEAKGVVVSLTRTPDGAHVSLRAPADWRPAIGASIAVNGACSTVLGADTDGTLRFSYMPETLTRTTLGALTEGSEVNLERPLRADGRFDGHVVQGHVDATGTITSITSEGDSTVMRVAIPSTNARFVVSKGSIAVDGVSLTVVDADTDSFTVKLLPHTREHTTFGTKRAGAHVNLEFDILAKYIERMMRTT